MSARNDEFQIYKELEKLKRYIIDECPSPLGRGNKRTVEVDFISEMLTTINTLIPSELNRAQSVLEGTNVIIDDAEREAANIIHQAEIDAGRILEQAKISANRTIEDANKEHDRLVSDSVVLADAKSEAEAYLETKRNEADELYGAARNEAKILLEDALNAVDGSYRMLFKHIQMLDETDMNENTTAYDEQSEPDQYTADDGGEGYDEPEAEYESVKKKGGLFGGFKKMFTSNEEEYDEDEGDDDFEDEDTGDDVQFFDN